MEIILFVLFWLWVAWVLSRGKVDADPDRAYGEVDSDGDFGN